MTIGMRLIAGFAGFTMAVGLATSPAQAVVATSSYSGWVATNGPVTGQPNTTSSGFSITTATNNRDYVYSPGSIGITGPISATTGAVLLGVGGWLGATGTVVEGSVIAINRVSFNFPSAFGFYLSDAVTTDFTVVGYSNGAPTIPLFSLTLTGSDLFFGLSAMPANVAQLVISTNNESRFAVGDFFRAGAPVPEPASMLLLGAGLVGLGAARRRNKRA